MANWLSDLLHNRVLLAAVAGWFAAQFLKVLLVLVLERKFVAERIFGSGGMPSSHSATVCALCAASAGGYGFGSFQFAVSFVFSFIVMYDACHVRLETGKQAVAIKELQDVIRKLGNHALSPADTLKELVGHTFPQVIVGALLGIGIGVAVVLI